MSFKDRTAVFVRGIKDAIIGAAAPEESLMAPPRPAKPAEASAESPTSTADSPVPLPESSDARARKRIEAARQVADEFVGSKVRELKEEAWVMVDMLEERLDKKLDEFERRLDERLKRELHWKMVGLRWTLIFVLLATLIGIGYTILVRLL